MGTIYKSGIPYSGGGGSDELFYITVDADNFTPSVSNPDVMEMELTSPYTIAELNTILSKTKPESIVLRVISTNGTSQDINDIVLDYMSRTGYEGDLFLTSVYGGVTHKYVKFIITLDNAKTMLRMYQGDISDGSNTYSTDEQAIGTWVDGKIIYQKTMTCAMPTDIVDGTTKSTYVPHGVSNIAQIIGCESVSKATSGNVGGEDGNMSIGDMFTHISADSYQINLSANMSEFSGKEYFVTFRYTKTT